MVNKVWNFLLICGIIFAFITGSLDKVGEVILTSATDAFNIFLKMALLIVFWNGIFNIAIKASLIKNVTKLLKKPLTFLFPEIDPKTLCMDYIASCMVANILGLGLAATPLGLKAFELLQKENSNPNIPTRSMITLVLLNISTLTLFPTTIISIRKLSGGNTDFPLILMMILVTLIGFIFTIFLDRLIYVIKKKKHKC